MIDSGFILAIDDEDAILEAINIMVEDSFPNLALANSIESAKARLRERTFSCILVDIDINGENGAEIIKFIRQEKPMGNDKAALVIISGYVDADFKKKFKNKVEGTLAKPFDDKELIKVIEDAINQRTPSKTISLETDEGYVSLDVFDPEICSPFNIHTLEGKVRKILNGLETKKDFLKAISMAKLKDNHLMIKRAGLLININTALLKELQWDSRQNLEKFVYASYLHDIALGNNPKFIRYHCCKNKEPDFVESENDKKLIHYHGEAGAKMLEGFHFITQDVLTMIKQHHELPNGSGYPQKMEQSRITPMASVFIISQNLCNYILEAQEWSIDGFLESHEFLMEGPHFKKALRVLKNLK